MDRGFGLILKIHFYLRMLYGVSVQPVLCVQTATDAVVKQLIKSQIKSGQMIVKKPLRTQHYKKFLS